MANFVRTSILVGLVAFLSVIGRVTYHRASVLGVLRTIPATDILPENIVKIPDTVHCEDVHYYEPGDVLFTACEDRNATRYSWFPPLDIFNEPQAAGRGSIHVIDPKTMTSKRLEFHEFDGPFVTHGIDVISDPKREDAVYVFAVNHLPNPDYFDKTSHDQAHAEPPKARSQIEVFHHVLGTSGLTHLRSVRHELITTPNDVLAVDPTVFYVTNDHYYRDGALRAVEDTFPVAKWTSTTHVRVSSLDKTSAAENGVEASIAAPRLHNNNGLGHGPRINATDSEVLVTSASSGVLHRMRRSTRHEQLELIEPIYLHSVVDNPSFFSDAYGTGEHDDLSGYVVGGLGKGAEFSLSCKDHTAVHPVMVWYVPYSSGRREMGSSSSSSSSHVDEKLLFQDDGSTISSLSAAVIVPDPPSSSSSGGSRSGWLFVSGFVSESMLAVKLDLSSLRQKY